MRQRRLMNQINVVPYIDVMLVLLVIFMVAAPMIQYGSVEVPSVGKSAPPPVAPMEVTIKADGAMTFRDRAKGANETSASRKEIADRVASAQAASPEQAVVIAADKSVRYEAVMGLMDELQRRNIKRIGLMVQQGGGK